MKIIKKSKYCYLYTKCRVLTKMITQTIVYAIIATFIGISQSAGIGGGPILNICLMIGFGYDAKQSMSITYLFLMGGATASIWKNFKKVHPQTNKLQMDYNLIMMTLPMAASGSIFGTLTNHFISEFVITILFTVLLGYLSYDTYKKLKTYSTIADPQKSQNLLQKDTELAQIHTFGYEATVNPDLQKIIEEENRPLPTDKLKIVGFVFVYTLIILLCKGGQSYDSFIGLQKCSTGGYILVILHLVMSFIVSKSVAIQIFEKDAEKEKLGYIFQNQSDKMTSRKMWNSMLSGFCAGVMGGALGLGGAIILVPVWLNSGIDKLVATSSSAPLIFFSALIAFFMALLAKSYQGVFMLIFYFILAFIGSAVVRTVVQYIAEKYNLKTMIFILLLITMVSSLVVLLPYQINKYFQDPHSFMKFGRFC